MVSPSTWLPVGAGELVSLGLVCLRKSPLSCCFLSTAKNTVVRGLENVEAPEGGEALFECQLAQPEVAAHTWLLDDEPVHSSDRAEVVYFEDGLRHLLLLKNLRPQDSCRVTFLAGDAVTSAFLTVRGEHPSRGEGGHGDRGEGGQCSEALLPAGLLSLPTTPAPLNSGWRLEVLEPLQDVSVRAGQQAHFRCTLSEAVPVGEASWYINGAAVQPDDADWTVTADGSRHGLLLRSAQPHHAGEVTFAAREAVATARLSVLGEWSPCGQCVRVCGGDVTASAPSPGALSWG